MAVPDNLTALQTAQVTGQLACKQAPQISQQQQLMQLNQHYICQQCYLKT